MLPRQRRRDPQPRRGEAGEIGAPEHAEGVAHHHERHEEGHLQQEFHGAEGPRAEPPAQRDGESEGQRRPRRGHAHRVQHVTRVESPDCPIVRERPLPVPREAGHERDTHGPQEDGAEYGEGRAARGSPEQALASGYRTISSYARVIMSWYSLSGIWRE